MVERIKKMEKALTAQHMETISIILTIIGGVMAILAFIKSWNTEEKSNAVDIANIKKDIAAQDLANRSLRDEMRREVGHLQADIREVKIKQDAMQEVQSEMRGDIKILLKNIKTN